jgi:phosphatidylglycerophosphate synthase
VTLAVLLTAGGSGRSDRLTAQLREAGAAEVRVSSGSDAFGDLRAIAEAARATRGPLVVCTDDLVAHTGALLTLLTEPGGGSVALVGQDPAAAGVGQAAVREERGQIAAAGVRAPPPSATGRFLGVLRVGPADLSVLAGCAERLAAGRLFAGPAADEMPGAADLLLAELLATGIRVGACRVRLLVAERVTDGASVAAAEERVRAVDEEAARLRLAVKERDDFFTTYFVSSFSPRLVRWAARLGLSPTAVTGLSVVLALVAAAGYATGDRPAMVAGSLLLYASFVLDCVDGQLARYRRMFSAFGGWLDTMADRFKEYVVYAALAAGAVRSGLGDVWALAIAALVLQTARHMTDYWYGALHDAAVARNTAPGGLAGRLGSMSEKVQSQTGSVAYWLKRIVVFPIGERWALIALTAALFDGRVALIAVLVWGGLAAAYTLSLRTLRSRGMRVPVLASGDTAAYRDDGPLARWVARTRAWGRPLPLAALAAAAAAGLVVAAAVDVAFAPLWVAGAALVVLAAALPAGARHDGPLDWLVPAALRAAEFLFVAGVAVAYEVPPALVFALLLVLALRHYDRVARLEKRAAAAAAPAWDLGWEGRVAVYALLALAGAATPATALLAGYVGLVFCVGALGAWAGTRASPQEALR